MENKFWTILTLYVNHIEKTFYLQNFGWNEEDIIKNFKLDEHEIEIFRKTYFNGFEKDINDNEFKLLLEYCITNMTVLGVYDIRNSYNRDQKIINSIKDNERKIWLNKGYTEINHNVAPEFDYNRKNTAINKRDYLYLLNQRISEYEKELQDIQDTQEENIKSLENEYNNKINNIENLNKLKIENLEKELQETNDIICKNKEKIIKQNWYIEETKNVKIEYENLKNKFDKLVERYKNGQKCIEEQKDKLPIEIKQLVTQKEILTDEISKIKDSIHDLNNIINEKQHYIEKLNNECNTYKGDINLNNEKICNQIKNILFSITNDKISFEEAKTKFYNTVKMYVFNNKKLPDFEIEYAEKLGLDKETIDSIIRTIES